MIAFILRSVDSKVVFQDLGNPYLPHPWLYPDVLSPSPGL